MASVGLVVPAYQPVPTRLINYVRALTDAIEPETIRIELDAPEAGVVDALQDLTATVNTVPYRRGKGVAITAGFEALDTDILGFVDADGSTPVESVQTIIESLQDGFNNEHERNDLAVGSRRHPDAVVTHHQTHIRRRLGDIFAQIARRLLGIDLYDFQCGAKALTAKAWDAVRQHLYSPGFAWDIELITVSVALGYTIDEIPIAWEDKDGSTVSPIRTPLSMGRELLAVRHRARALQGESNATHNSEDESALVDRENESAVIDQESQL